MPAAAPTRLPLVARRMEFLAADLRRAAASIRSVGDESEARAAAAALAHLVGEAGGIADRLASRLDRYARVSDDPTEAQHTRALATSLEDLAGVVAGLAGDVQELAVRPT